MGVNHALHLLMGSLQVLHEVVHDVGVFELLPVALLLVLACPVLHALVVSKASRIRLQLKLLRLRLIELVGSLLIGEGRLSSAEAVVLGSWVVGVTRRLQGVIVIPLIMIALVSIPSLLLNLFVTSLS